MLRRWSPDGRGAVLPLGTHQSQAVLRGSTENQNLGDRLMCAVADALLRDMGVGSSYRFSHWDRRFGAIPAPHKVRALFDLGNVYYCDSWPQPLSDRIHRSLRFNREFPRASVVYLPCGWGPYRMEDRPLVRQLTAGALVFARDQISRHYLNDALQADRAELCPDLALLCQPEAPGVGADLLDRLGISEREPLLGLIPNVRCVEEGVSPLADPALYRRHLHQVVDWSRTNGYQVVGIPHTVDTDRDRLLLDGLHVPVVEGHDPATIRSVIANLSLAVCSRYHGLVNCLVHGVPVISLGWQHKYRGLMQYFDLPDFDHPLAEPSGQLRDRLAFLALSREHVGDQIERLVSRARQQIRISMGRLSSRLGGPSSVLAAPVQYANEPIATVAQVRSPVSVRVFRRIRRLVAA
jgi:hypothetical protein